MTTHRRQTAARWLIVCSVGLALGLGVLGAAGCQETRMTSGFHRPMPPKPRPLPRVPADARADALVLNISAAPLDTNGNGYADLILASAHLFDRRYPSAMHEDGAFVFLLYGGGDVARPGSQPIREWRIDDEVLRQSHVRSAFGDGYRFRLSLLEGGTDTLPIAAADIACRFEPADGRPPIYPSEISSIQMGLRSPQRQPFEWREEVKPSAETDGGSTDVVPTENELGAGP
ncbi:MAG: hypothetical protein ACYSTY_07365 [Planctomycetota bacterium]|jgi:hypothetical protein